MYTGIGNIKLIVCHSPDNVLIKQVDMNILNIAVYPKLMGHPGSHFAAAAAAKSLQSCPSLCDPIDGSPPGSPVPGILQARTLAFYSSANIHGAPTLPWYMVVI